MVTDDVCFYCAQPINPDNRFIHATLRHLLPNDPFIATVNLLAWGGIRAFKERFHPVCFDAFKLKGCPRNSETRYKVLSTYTVEPDDAAWRAGLAKQIAMCQAIFCAFPDLEEAVLERILLDPYHGWTLTRRQKADVRSNADDPETSLARQQAICRVIFWQCPDFDPALLERIGLVHDPGWTMNRDEIEAVRQWCLRLRRRAKRTTAPSGEGGKRDEQD